MRIAGVLTCSLVNGEGCRYVIFTQGCKHGCRGCQNPDTWDFGGGYEVSVESLVEDIRKHRMIDGITLSGGDPMEQEEECLKLLDLLPGMNVWLYTGYEWSEISDRELARRADVVVTGKFVEELRCEGQYYGSSNQKILRKGADYKGWGLYTEYYGDTPIAYRYGEPWVVMQLAMEGGYKTPEEAKQHWLEEHK